MSADAPVLEAVERMVNHVGALMVCSKDDGSHLDGTTERDHAVVVQARILQQRLFMR